MRCLLFGQSNSAGPTADCCSKNGHRSPGNRPNSGSPPWSPSFQEPTRVPTAGEKRDQIFVLPQMQFCGCGIVGAALATSVMMLVLISSGGIGDHLHWILFRFTGVSMAKFGSGQAVHGLLELDAASRAEERGQMSGYFARAHTHRIDGGRRGAAASRSRKRVVTQPHTGAQPHTGENLLPERVQMTVNAMDVQISATGSKPQHVKIGFDIEGVPMSKWHSREQKLLQDTVENIVYHKVLAPRDHKSPKHAKIKVALAWDANQAYIKSGAVVHVDATIILPELTEGADRLLDFRHRAERLTESDIVKALQNSELSKIDHPYSFHVPGTWPKNEEPGPLTPTVDEDDVVQTADDSVKANNTEDDGSMMRTAESSDSKSTKGRPTPQNAKSAPTGDERIEEMASNSINARPKREEGKAATTGVVESNRSNARPPPQKKEGAATHEAVATGDDVRANADKHVKSHSTDEQSKPESLLLITDVISGIALAKQPVASESTEIGKTEQDPAGTPAKTDGELDNPKVTPTGEVDNPVGMAAETRQKKGSELNNPAGSPEKTDGELDNPTGTPTVAVDTVDGTATGTPTRTPTKLKNVESDLKWQEAEIEKGSPADGKFKAVPYFDHKVANEIDESRLARLERLKVKDAEKKAEQHEEEPAPKHKRKSAASLTRVTLLTFVFSVLVHVTAYA